MTIETIEIEDGRYFAATWFVGPGRCSDGRTVDIHGALWRDPGGSWVLQYRFRYYADDRVDETSEDEKSWYRGDLRSADGEPEEALVARLTGVFEAMGLTMGCCRKDVHTVPIRSAVAEVVASTLASQSWSHMRFEGMNGPTGDA